ncbi:cytochrome b/b6 domain-containing protein [Marinimicrobium sp. ARAG 43.8]|uniref:cytochrome b/b6 domain-containing protein n=1 Tax=Marinimicrobium sp. ARAG 43.8 TaxID=3418719 RepID=UPI003CEB5A9F
MTVAGSAAKKQPLWDGAIRATHWLIVLLVAACWWTAENGEIVYHTYCAYGLLGVVLFRFYWGFFGSSTARFSHFLKKPSTVWQYLKALPQRGTPASAGHNPLGGYSALALLLLLLVQIVLGLFAIDVDGFDGGPFADYLSFRASRMLTGWHEFTFNLLLVFIALHIVAIAYYLLWRKQNLTAAMFHGRANVSPAMTPVGFGRLAFGVLLAAAVVWLIV